MNTESKQQEDNSATSAIAFFWAVLRQIMALLAGGNLAAVAEQLDKLERDLDAHVRTEALKYMAAHGLEPEPEDDEPLYRIVHINGRFKRVLVQPHERSDLKIRRAAILGYAQYKRALRVIRLANQIAGAGRTRDHRALRAFQFQQLISTASRLIAAGFSSAPLHAAALAPVPP